MTSVKSLFSTPARLLLSLILLLTAGCGPLISLGPDGAVSYYDLGTQSLEATPDQSSRKTMVHSGQSDINPARLRIMPPLMMGGLDGQAITVAFEDGRRASLTGARWAAPLSKMLHNRIEDRLTNISGVTAYGEGLGGLDVSCRVIVRVRDFQLVVKAQSAQDIVSVAMDITLLRNGDNTPVDQVTLRQAGEVSDNNAAIIAALQRASHKTLDLMADWVSARADQCR